MILGGPFVPLGGFIIPCPDLGGVCYRQPKLRDIYLCRSQDQHRLEALWR